MADPNHQQFDVVMQIVSKPIYLCMIRAAIGAGLDRLGLDEAESGKVMLAVDEAVTNIMRHGYDNAEDKPIWLRYRPATVKGRQGFVIVIEDVAKQVEPEVIRGRDLEDVRPGGLGVHIIRQVMDEVEYTKRDGAGMRLYMAKALSPAETTTG